MATKIKAITLVIPVMLVLLAARCTHKGHTIKGIPVTHFYDSCETANVYFGDMITIGDPAERFFISLPYSWDIRESYTDSVYGIYASNFLSIPIEVENRLSVMITGYETDLSGDDYVLNEIRNLKKDDAVELMETGMVQIDDRDSHWLMFHNRGEHLIYHLVVYVKNDDSNEIYLIQSMTFDTDNYRDKLCQLKRLVKTFDIEDD